LAAELVDGDIDSMEMVSAIEDGEEGGEGAQ